jgi:hypothetical protein
VKLGFAAIQKVLFGAAVDANDMPIPNYNGCMSSKDKIRNKIKQ